jgi:[glutamine synthetase] adenylyltransferase / [glutamine synthetase]-adenylyl-L-tyrosine phosphorylase
LARLTTVNTAQEPLRNALTRAEAHSPHLRQLLGRHADVASALYAGALDQALSMCGVAADLPLGEAMRLAKGRLALALGLGDLAGLLSLEAVVASLSAFADETLDRAIAAAIVEHVPGAEPQGFVALALGKHGSSELNYSSDIDPIFLFDPATLPHRAREDVGEAAVRIGRRVVELIQARTEHGYVFRVDLRLRPSPEVTPIVLPIGAAISYYESAALPWERAAYIRARSCSGDIALGQGFLEAIQPFIWRRGLDFGTIREIRGMSHRIRGHYASGQAFGPGYDLKRGRGGIREVEFFAQIHQLIHGGRDESLRAPATMEAMAALSGAGIIPAVDAEALSQAYRQFRTFEHRLQMVGDQQTHSLPKDRDALENVARLHGFPDAQLLLDQLAPHVERVGKLYDALDGDAINRLPAEAAELEGMLAAMGLGEERLFADRIAGWRSGASRALRTTVSQDALEAVLPRLMQSFAVAPDAATALNRLDTMIERLPSALNLFRLLEARPQLLDLLMDVLCLAPTLALDLSRRTQLLDGLIDATALAPAPEIAAIIERLTLQGGDLERQLDHVRSEVGEMRFALGVQLVEAVSDPLDVAAGYARVAEGALNVVTDAVRVAFEAAHGRVPESELIILALGRLGGGELTHASDLDLVYLFSGDFRVESDGPKPLGAMHYYNRLAQRVSAGLSVPTAAGALYEVDLRLRPSGGDGPIAVSLEGFERYQREDAWTWEHLALTRARPVYGSRQGKAAAQSIIDRILAQPRDKAKLRAEAAKMRGDMASAKPPRGALDVKLAEGGLVDLEFALQLRQLEGARSVGVAMSAKVAEFAPGLEAAQALLTRFLVALRLVAPDFEEPALPVQALMARACGHQDWRSLLAELDAARQRVRNFWLETIEP